MPDVKVTYDSVAAVTSVLRGAVTKTVPELESLKETVRRTLASDGGLWLRDSSPVLESQYEKFNTSLTEAVANINNFAKQFDGIVTSLQQMDSQISTSGH